jgi:RNA polymerase sigma-70 factor, ECF subfamily
MRRLQSMREEAASRSVDRQDEATQRRLDELMQEHQTFLLGLARKLCRGNFDADDLVQDVMLKAVAHFDRLPADVNHAAWMARVMRNLFVDRVRARASSPSPVDLDDVPLSAPVPDERAWWEELSASEIAEAVAQLPDELRIAFERFAFERQSYKEISAALGVPVATVGTRVLRARRRLRTLLGGTPDE